MIKAYLLLATFFLAPFIWFIFDLLSMVPK